MNLLRRSVLRGWVGVVAASGTAASAAPAASAPPRFEDGFGLTVVGQPVWADDAERTFTAKSDQVPAYTVLPNEQSPAQHVESLRSMGVALYTGDGGDLAVVPIQAAVENRARRTALVTAADSTEAGIPYEFADYRDGTGWAPGCTGKHNQDACLQADMDHFVPLAIARLKHP